MEKSDNTSQVVHLRACLSAEQTAVAGEIILIFRYAAVRSFVCAQLFGCCLFELHHELRIFYAKRNSPFNKLCESPVVADLPPNVVDKRFPNVFCLALIPVSVAQLVERPRLLLPVPISRGERTRPHHVKLL